MYNQELMPAASGEKSFKDIRQTTVDKDGFRRMKLRETNKIDWLIRLLVSTAILVTVYCVFYKIEYKWDDLQGDVALKMFSNFLRFDQLGIEKMVEMLVSLLNTLALGILTTFLGMVLGIVLGLFSAKNLVAGIIPNMIRSFASIIRAVPTIIWVLIVVAGFGLTATTAIVGMFFHTLAFFIKSFAESFEEVEVGTIEALKATGANWFQIVFSAVLPSSLTKVISWLAIRSEINFGVAVIIGPAAGVPGTIGTIINNASRAGDYYIQGFGVLLIFLTAFVLEFMINRVRQRSIVQQH